jgi:Ca2+/Na+ antiporter
MMRKSATESEYKFQLKQNYTLLISKAEQENKSMKSKPSIVAGITLFLIPILSRDEFGYDREIFWFFVILAVALYIYLKYQYKYQIQSNDELIPIWKKEAELQEKYSNFLYKLEEDYESSTRKRFAP